MANLPAQKTKDRIAKRFYKLLSTNDLIDELINVVAEECQPEEVFDVDVLNDWAKENGFVLKDDDHD